LFAASKKKKKKKRANCERVTAKDICTDMKFAFETTAREIIPTIGAMNR